MQRKSVWAGLVLAVAFGVAACGSSGPGSSSGTTQPRQSTTSSAPARSSTTTTAATPTTSLRPMVTASLPLIVCNSTSGAPTTTTSLPASVSVSVPPNDQQSNLAVYSDAAGRLMLVGPTSGWTCSASFGADGSGTMALLPVGTSLPANTSTSWHLPAASTIQAITATETGGSTVNGASLACPLFSGAQATTQQNLGRGCAPDPAQEQVVRTSASEATFQDPPGVAGIGIPSGGQNQANGVMLYQAKAGEATTYLATCTLPASQQDLCSAVLHHFVTNFG